MPKVHKRADFIKPPPKKQPTRKQRQRERKEAGTKPEAA